MTLDIKHYIPNSVPSKLVLPKSVIVLVAIDHQMVVIQVQVGKNLLKGGDTIKEVDALPSHGVKPT